MAAVEEKLRRKSKLSHWLHLPSACRNTGKTTVRKGLFGGVAIGFVGILTLINGIPISAFRESVTNCITDYLD